MNKEDFYYEVIEKVLKWTNDWDKFKNNKISVEPMSTQQLVEHLIKFENDSIK